MLAHHHQDDMAFFMRPEIPNYFCSLIRDSKVWCLCVVLRGGTLDSKMISWKLLLFEIPMIGICVRKNGDSKIPGSSHKHGNEKWVPPILVTFQIQSFSTSMMEKVNYLFLHTIDSAVFLSSNLVNLVGGWHSHLKNMRQSNWIMKPQKGVNIKKGLKLPPSESRYS